MSKKYKAILFDMDGTLVPMDMKEFTDGYFVFLAKKLAPFGISAEKLVPAVWKGTAAMVRNDGSRPNDAAFWECFEQETGLKEEDVRAACDEFYGNEFREAKMFTQDNPLAVEAIEVARDKADMVILATNPLFPMVGHHTRMSWVGLNADMFDLITSYESDSYCKPNPKYFDTVCERIGCKPSECLMVGNDEEEDMYACTLAGIDGYLVTDTMIKSKEHPWEGPHGTFAQMVQMLKSL